MFAYIGRQAIYGKNMMIAGYELLYRSGANGNRAQILDGDAATRAVLSDAITVFGLSRLTDGLPAYINFTRNLLLDNFAYLADPKEIVVEVPGDITVDEGLIDKLSDLRRSGYRLALDGYSEFNGVLRFDSIIHFFDVIGINVGQSDRLKLANLIRRLRRSNAKLLAQRIENEDDFDKALHLDFSLFQGYYFEKPVKLSKQIPPLSKSQHGQLINELMQPTVNFDRCADIIYSDAVMTYQFLNQMQMMAFARGRELSEIRRGLVVMGTDELLRWVCLVLLKQYNITPSEEMPRRAFQRGRFVELLMTHSDTELEPRQGFLMGMFSLLDKVMGVRLENLLQGMQLEPALKDALLGRRENEYSLYLQYVVIYEMGNPRLILPDIGLHPGIEGMKVYMASMTDTDVAFDAVGPRVIRAYSGTILRPSTILGSGTDLES